MSKPSATSGSHPPDISVDKFEIIDGAIHIGHSGGDTAGAQSSYQNVHLVARNISSTTAMPITFSATIPGGGTMEMEGQAGPLNPGNTTKTPLDLHVALKHADLGGTGLVDQSSALGGTLDFDGQIKSDGRSLHSEGKANATGLRLVKGGQPAKQAVSLDYSSDYALDSETGKLQANLHIGNSTTSTSGTLRAHGQGAVADLKIQGKDMAVNDVEGLLPAFGIVMPAGASLHDGTINLDLTAEGPLDRLVITGPLHVADAHLTGYNLTSKMAAIAAFTGIKASDDTLIQTLSSDLKVAPDGIRADNILLDAPSMGQLTGSGVIGSDNSLNFKMVLMLSSKGGNLLGSLVNIGGGNKNNGIPFLIKGTTSNPAFLPDIGGSLKTGLKNFLTQGDQQDDGQQKQGLGGLLGGFLKKKPKPQQPQQ
jgi:AsmA protein